MDTLKIKKDDYRYLDLLKVIPFSRTTDRMTNKEAHVVMVEDGWVYATDSKRLIKWLLPDVPSGVYTVEKAKTGMFLTISEQVFPDVKRVMLSAVPKDDSAEAFPVDVPDKKDKGSMSIAYGSILHGLGKETQFNFWYMLDVPEGGYRVTQSGHVYPIRLAHVSGCEILIMPLTF